MPTAQGSGPLAPKNPSDAKAVHELAGQVMQQVKQQQDAQVPGPAAASAGGKPGAARMSGEQVPSFKGAALRTGSGRRSEGERELSC